LNILELPQRFKCEEDSHEKEEFKLYRLNTSTYSIDIKSLRTEKVQKCFIDIVDIPDSKRIDPLLAFFQYKDHLHIESFNSKSYNKKFNLQMGEIPMVKFKEHNRRVQT
jgi:hypothetical protein